MKRDINKEIDKRFFREARREVAIAHRQLRCQHSIVMWDVTGKTGICVECGFTVKREEREVSKKGG
ncbi:MAG: hypothetical protein QXU79_01530 [Candidatus Micrarchaeaceae archaeon]